MNAPRLSLIVATLGRVEEPGLLLESIAAQPRRDLEILFVDQNPDDRLGPLLARHGDALALRRIRSAPGLSLARNAGLALAAGEIVAFPDDDCRYPPETLGRALAFMDGGPNWDGLLGSTVDERGRRILSGGDGAPGPVNERSVWRRGNSCSIFLRRSLIDRVGAFDERLGVGAGTPWESGEETELLLRALAAGGRIFYDPALHVLHPAPGGETDGRARRRAYAYGRGMGSVLRGHPYPWSFRLSQSCRALGGAALHLFRGNPGRAGLYLAAFRGRMRGLLDADRSA